MATKRHINNIPILKNIQRGFRKKRLSRFLAGIQPEKDWSIVDVGGTPRLWSYQELRELSVTLVNLHPIPIPQDQEHRLKSVEGNGCELALEKDQFELAFSNSVIEHVGTWENQQKFAQEIRRVSPRVWVQTPAQEFFIEPHYLAPFIHWLPKKMRRHLIRNFTFWGLLNRPSKALVEESLTELRLLTKKEMQELFPDCELIEEKFLGMTKSYIAKRVCEN